ncbi:glycosyltransferase [Roseiflexus sp.]|uniref:glycosyltransferase n=1 Tax=Roseiflexus sp. TaxID=2562120 RepID=UPI00398AE496
MSSAAMVDFDNPPGSNSRPKYNYTPQNIAQAPAVTIITPFYNTGTVFHETARSILSQSFQQWEWVIVNDGSSDPESLAILDQYRDIDPRVRIIDCANNRGLSAARNLAVEHARTEFIVNIDSDDLLEPTAVEKWFWFLTSYPQFAFVDGYVAGFGSQTYLWRLGFHQPEKFLVENQTTSNVMFRRSVHIDVGGFDEEIKYGFEDWDFWLRCASKGYWGDTIPECLTWYRRRPDHSDRWKSFDGGNYQRSFAAQLRQKYPELWRVGVPTVYRHQPTPYSEVCDTLPATNLLRSSKKRLLMLLPWMEMGGADKFNLDVVRELTMRRDYEITIITTLSGNNSWYNMFAKYTPDIFVLDRFLCINDYPRFIRYIIQSRQIKTVLISNSEFAYLISPYLRIHFPDLCIMDFLHMEEKYWKNGGYPRLSLIHQSQLDLTVVSSQHLKNWMVKRGAAEEDVRVCTMNIDPDEWNPYRYDRRALRETLGIDKDQSVILYAGRLVEQKQPMLAMQVLLDLKHLNIPFVALVAGNGPFFAKLSEFVDEHRMTEVKLLGAVSNERIRELLALSDIFFLPSLQEGISLAVYEAMAMEVTPVVADVGGQKELVTPECGFLVSRGPSERDEYVRVLRFLLSNPAQCRAMGHRARERICEHFRLDQMVMRMCELLDEAQQRRQMKAFSACDTSVGHQIAVRVVEMQRLQILADWLWARLEMPQNEQRQMHLYPRVVPCVKSLVRPFYRRLARTHPQIALALRNTARRLGASLQVRRLIAWIDTALHQG